MHMYMYQNFKFSLTLLIQMKKNLALNHRSLHGDCTRATGLWRTKSSGFTQTIGLYRDHRALEFLHTLEFYKYTLVKNYAKFY